MGSRSVATQTVEDSVRNPEVCFVSANSMTKWRAYTAALLKRRANPGLNIFSNINWLRIVQQVLVCTII